MNAILTVVLVHGNQLEGAQLRSALEALPGVQIAGERGDLRAGLSLAHQVRPSILVLELGRPVDDVLSAASQYKLQNPDVAIFFSTDAFDSDTLLRAMRAGASEILRRPLDRSALSQAVERVAALAARKAGAEVLHKLFTVFSSKGGAGVTTIATNLAIGLQAASAGEVALADLDVQSGDVAFFLGVTPQRSIADLLNAAKLDSATVRDIATRHASGIHVLPQPEHIDGFDGLSADQVGAIAEILCSTFDTVVVDAPHVIGDIAVELFDRSSSILLVAEPNIPSVRAARRSLDIFSKLNYLAVPDRVRLVINRHADQNAISLEQIEETLGVPVFASIANDYAAVSNAINTGKPLCGGPMPGRAGRDILALGKKLMPRETHRGSVGEAAPARKQNRLRLFGKG